MCRAQEKQKERKNDWATEREYRSVSSESSFAEATEDEKTEESKK